MSGEKSVFSGKRGDWLSTVIVKRTNAPKEKKEREFKRRQNDIAVLRILLPFRYSGGVANNQYVFQYSRILNVN